MDKLSGDLELQIFAVCDVGSVRPRNEDIIVVDGALVRDDSYSIRIRPPEHDGGILLGVADGVGGSVAGDEASNHVAERLATAVQAMPTGLRDGGVKSHIEKEAQAIHRSLFDWGTQDPAHAGMATTFAGIMVYDQRIWYVNAGDSRVYRIRRDGIFQLSRDHSLRELTGNAAIPSNIIANCFGAESEFFVDVVRVNDSVGKGDGFLVCSDGLSDLVDDEELEEVLSESDTLQSAGAGMVERAKSYGGRDNISVLLVAAQ
jgi:protein phosphatase